MKRPLVIAILILLGLTSLSLVYVHRCLPDGLQGSFRALLYGDDTVYAEGYSDANFLAVRPGMTTAEVSALLGEPLYWEDGRRLYWGYSFRGESSDNFRMRTVVFVDGRVHHTDAHFFVRD